MNQKKHDKPIWEMTIEELSAATRQFDEEFVAEKSRPLTRQEHALWDEVKAMGSATYRDGSLP